MTNKYKPARVLERHRNGCQRREQHPYSWQRESRGPRQTSSLHLDSETSQIKGDYKDDFHTLIFFLNTQTGKGTDQTIDDIEEIQL